jgi:hypothetical protein
MVEEIQSLAFSWKYDQRSCNLPSENQRTFKGLAHGDFHAFIVREFFDSIPLEYADDRVLGNMEYN